MSLSHHTTNHQRLLSYTKLLTSHVNLGRHRHALALFARIHASPSLTLDPFVFPLALKSSAYLRYPSFISALHCLILKFGFLSSPFSASALVDAYGKTFSIASARRLFDECPQRNAIVWNSMIALYSRSGDVSNALCLFDSMDIAPSTSIFNSIVAALADSDGSGCDRAIEFYRKMKAFGIMPNQITLLALLRACVGKVDFNFVKEIHGFSLRNCARDDVQLSSGMVEAYGKCGGPGLARKVFDGMIDRDVVTWSSMISVYAFHGEAESAMGMFLRMVASDMRPDGIMFLAILKACSHAGRPKEALKFFGLMGDYAVEAGSDHYACLVDVLGRAGRLQEAYEVIKGMPVQVTGKAWGALLGACRSYGEVKLAEIAGKMLFEIEPENAGNFVILANIYASAGMFEEAENIRTEMKERFVRRASGSSWVMSPQL